MIEIQLDRDTFKLGETVKGQAIWNFPKGKKYKAGCVQLLWRTEGRGSIDQELVQTISLTIDPDAVLPQVFPFAFLIPPMSPISYDGQLLRILWQVLAYPISSGIQFRPQSTQIPIQVLPR